MKVWAGRKLVCESGEPAMSWALHSPGRAAVSSRGASAPGMREHDRASPGGAAEGSTRQPFPSLLRGRSSRANASGGWCPRLLTFALPGLQSACSKDAIRLVAAIASGGVGAGQLGSLTPARHPPHLYFAGEFQPANFVTHPFARACQKAVAHGAKRVILVI